LDSLEELRAELEAKREELALVKAEVASNDEKMRRTQQREMRLLQAESLDALIFALIDGLRVSYGLEYVSLVLCALLLATGSANAQSLSPARWRADLDSVLAWVHEVHADPFNKVSEAAFRREMKRLKQAATSQNPDERLVGLMRLIPILCLPR